MCGFVEEGGHVGCGVVGVWGSEGERVDALGGAACWRCSVECGVWSVWTANECG